MKLLVIRNLRSGHYREDQVTHILDLKKEQHGWDVRVFFLDDESAQEKIRGEIRSFRPDVLVAAGGDGTVNFTAGVARGQNIPFAIIPSGSANGMAHELLIPPAISDAFDVIANGRLLPVDLLLINGKICIHLADVGVNARIVKRFQKDPRRGLLTYAKYFFGELFLTKQYRFHIVYDGTSCVHKGVSLTFANSSKYGTGAIINPTGKIDDGCFELCLMKPFPKTQLPALAWKIFRGTLHTSDYFEVIPCKNAQVHTRKRTTLQIDGEVIGKVRDIRIEMLHRAVRVYVP
ncbi:MAG: diacylglycerol kinase [Mucilaginibacter polytrichastri]|nr:diacylglycerol kinase [Mucilaginibacter polytrichastri]